MPDKEIIVDSLERPLRDLRISLTDHCNFRCTYCMPKDTYNKHYQFLPRKETLSFDEITRLVSIFVKLGVSKLRLTGGEPLLRKDLPTLVSQLSNFTEIDDIALTTNGSLLAQSAEALKAAGLTRVTVSLDTLDPELFKKMSGGYGDLDKVLKGIEASQHAGFSPIKINTVVQKDVNDHCILDLAKHFKSNHYILRFIEFMDVGNVNQWHKDKVVSGKDIIETINAAMPIEAIPRKKESDVAIRYRYKKGDGEIGIIASITQPFCRNCTRARLSSNGQLHTCLFSTKGLDLKTPLREGRSDEFISTMIEDCWKKREDHYSEIRAKHIDEKKIEMYAIGG